MNTPHTDIQIHRDHCRWTDERALWRDDVRAWRQELEEAQSGLQHLTTVLEQHEHDLMVHEAAIAQYDQRDLRREHALADYERERNETKGTVLAHSHAAEIEQQARQRERHEQFKAFQHRLLSKLRSLLRTALMVVTVFSGMFITSRVEAQAQRADPRVYTFSPVQPYAYPAYGYAGGYPYDPYLDLWPYLSPRPGYDGLYRYYVPNDYPAGGYAWRDYFAPYRNPSASYGRPTYQPAYPYYGGYSTYVPYQDRRFSSGRAFPYTMPPMYQPRGGGVFDR